MSDVQGGREGALYSEVQCIMVNGHMGTFCVNRQTDTSENITFPQLCWWAVKIMLSKGR